ncbi:Protein kinase-like domain protein [Metarhizium album ARSEF 1941]|uniref:Protein kinase-like domain protein n=1 Tax=Metarhizium album (strain ARSEF 1941) TaxID=1081103 RepID=A0A0B2WD07_METAS|nr:Protein kinase-like domain protein [Metarhizium album ARSEF 1941]KHN93711.1 Protein kinase-like domain protein [Metarhizium album ARSEF 1941]
MEVHKASWKGQKVEVKYVHKSYTGQAYRRAFYSLNFELQLMSKPSLRKQNIPSLLAVCCSKDDDLTTCLEASASVVRPGIAVELAHEQYPDMRHFFDGARNMFRPKQLPFETSAALIADIADGMAALHHHDIVHADPKPENIPLYLDSQSPNGLVAKVADFGLVGMTTYRELLEVI